MKYLTKLNTHFDFAKIIQVKYLTTRTTLFYLIANKINYLTSHTTLFYFTAIELKSPTTLTTLFKLTSFKMSAILF